ncbi:MAG: nickel pincer cofactor biosynthesis protein LarC [Planctomycetaceae bacterium]|nr:nickel pincer cofactor biosynthesis protein LarC [Planctomycetaceae bacterium]
MQTGYLDCLSGISGDMMLGALVDVGVPLELLNDAVRSLQLPGVSLSAETVRRCGFRAAKIHVHAPHEHAHRHLHAILEIIEKSSLLTPKQKATAGRLFHRIAEVEAKVHGQSIEQVHFHEVGAVDSIADIVATVVGLDFLNLDSLTASPVPTGCGTVRIAHGVCSVPAPATAELLAGIPIAPSNIPFELTTPTGAAILAEFVKSYGSMPAMTVQKIGIGAGTKDFHEQPNVLRLILGEAIDSPSAVCRLPSEHIWKLETNLDDMSGEILGFVLEKLWIPEVLDVYTTPIQMKKGRPAITLTVLCREEVVCEVERILFTETSTLGIRKSQVQRTYLKREASTASTPWGEIAGKIAILPNGSQRFTPEYESAKAIAVANGVPLQTVMRLAERGD